MSLLLIYLEEERMRAVTILPTAYLALTENHYYHMALAHLIGKDRVYTDFYIRMAKEGNFVILDNGVIETGTPMPIQEVVARAKLIGASEIILPDFLDDSSKTLDSVCQDIPYARQHFKGSLMGVPQGATKAEWVECAKLMLEMDIDTMGIPKRLVKLGRDARLDVLETLAWSLRGRNVHLLGCQENPIECTMIEKAVKNKQIVSVRSVDSCIPYVYARENMYISQGPRPSGDVDFSAKDAVVEKLLRNIEIWEASCTLSNSDMPQLC